MEVILEAIKFNHDSTSATTDAFTIRRNETQPITVPEWQCGHLSQENSPAAYARDQTSGQTLTIKARFSCPDPSVKSIEVQAVDGHLHPPTRDSGGSTGALAQQLSLGNVLGRVRATDVPLNDGQSEFVPFHLDDVRIAYAGVSVSEVIWHWQFRINSSDTWTHFATTTHRIYTVLKLPTDPWKPLASDSQDTQIPWTEVLDLVCEWATGAQCLDAAAAEITRRINGLGDTGVTYFYAASYVPLVTENFECTAFLDLLRGGNGNGGTVNCFDCATAVSSFSNILGAALWQSRMGYNFDINHVRKIGESKEDGGSFLQHEVAWNGDATKEDRVFDACLLLDGDSNPSPLVPGFEPLLPINMPFGDFTDRQYRFRLKFDTHFGGPCEPDPDSKRRRIMATWQLKKSVLTPRQLDVLTRHYDFDTWSNTQDSDEQHLFIWRLFVSGNEVRGWQPDRVQSFNSSGEMPVTSRAFWRQEHNPGVFLRLDTYECASLTAARAFLLDVLGEFQTLDMKRGAAPTGDERSLAIGDVAFTDPEGAAVYFARGNIVVAIRNAGPNQTLVTDFGHAFDVSLRTRPEEGRIIGEMKHFRIPDEQFRVGDQVPLEFLPDELDRERLLYKFFTRSGGLSFKGRRLVYQPKSGGSQEIVVFGVDAEQAARVQALSIVIDDV